jgi:hypothetical protein
MFGNAGEQWVNLKRAVIGAFGYIYEYKSALAKALLLPLLLMVAISYLELQSSNFSILIILMVVSMFIYAIFAITTHRIILLGPQSVPTWGMYKLTKREARFVLYAIGLGLLTVPFSVFVFIPFIGVIFFLLAMFYLMGRLSLVFPAIATDNPLTFAGSWEATKEYQLFMIGVVAIFPAVISIPEILLYEIPYMEFLGSLFSLATTVLTVAALSMAYKILKEGINPPESFKENNSET